MEPFTEEDLREMVLRLAHEIRNPLATIQSGIQLVQHLSKPTGEVADYLEGALAEVTRIDKTLKDLQRFVRLDSFVPLIPVVIPGVVDQAVELHLKASEKARVRLEVRQGPVCRTQADPERILYALSELVNNAIRFSPPGGTVTIRWEIPGERLIHLRVDDDGPGIPEETGERVLRPFFSTSTQGTGLGLNIVNRICQLSGGSLSWANRSQGGCQFTITLPRWPSA